MILKLFYKIVNNYFFHVFSLFFVFFLFLEYTYIKYGVIFLKKKIVIFGGGTGLSFLVRNLKDFPVDITCVINVSDDGASTGKLREEFLMPAMGDIRKVISNLSNSDDTIKKLLEYRFDTYSDLNGHPVGNLIMVAMYNMTGSLKESIRVLSDFLDVSHKILPFSEDYLTLVAETVDGDIIRGEEVIGNDSRGYKRLYYDEEVHIDKEIISEILSADLIIFSMGSLYTSLIPNLLSTEIINAIDNSYAKLLYICNAVNQPPETTNYTVSDYVRVVNSYLGKRKIDSVFASCSKLPKDIIDKYVLNENKRVVKIDKKKIKDLNCELIEKDFLIIEDGYIRHDGIKLATNIFYYLMR